MKTIFIFTLTLLSLPGFGQSIKDYFLPKDGLNKSNYYTPNPQTGGSSGMETKIWFIKKADGFEVMEAKILKGEATSIVTKTIAISNNEIKLTKTVSTNILETNRQKTYSPAQTILKLPTVGQKLTWNYSSPTGETIKCTAELIDMKVKGENRKTIKVKKETLEDGKPITWATSIDYYVNGIGLYKIETLSEEILDVLDFQEYDSDAESKTK